MIIDQSQTIADYIEAGVLFGLISFTEQHHYNTSHKLDFAFLTKNNMLIELQTYADRPKLELEYELVLDRLVKNGIVREVTDEHAGSFFQLQEKQIYKIHNELVADNNNLYTNITAVGPILMHTALDKIINDKIDKSVEVGSELQSTDIPASDRIVRINHNQQTEFEEATSEVIDKVEDENSIDGDNDLRSRIIGQLKAGRELFRAGVFKAETLYLTLVVSLKLLVDKYEGHVIGATASKLIDLIYDYIGDALK